MKISRVLHAGYIFEDQQTRIIFDPIFENPFSKNCYAFPSVKFDAAEIRKVKFNAVFISHYHDDHCSFESLDLLDRNTPIYIFCIHEELFALVRELGFINVNALKIDCEVTIGKFRVTPRRAMDADIDSILQVRHQSVNVLNVVDSMLDPETLGLLKKEGPWDLVLWPFQSMRELAVIAPSRFPSNQVEIPEEWVDELRILNPKFLVPSSCQFIHEDWSWYNHALFPITYEKFRREISAALPETKIVRMNPSESIVLSNNSMTKTNSLSWVHPIGNQNVDYDYRPNQTPTPTSVIASHFSLNDEQKARVLQFCKVEMLNRYKELNHSDSFDEIRLWKLSLFDNRNNETQIFYRLENGSIAIASTADQKNLALAWATEVPIAKVYSALEHGEALTSMYLRIIDHQFSPEILDDPLIRILFEGKFGSYQKEQLKIVSK